ncbi:MAG TPA: hypothetical protein VGE07_12395 [Herpetosiphonaceae bacterium]
MAPHDTLLAAIIASLKEEFGDDLLGVLATGSRVHDTPGPTSDLDLHVVIASGRRQRRNWLQDGIEIECFINPPGQIQRYFADGRGVDQHMFAFGTIAYDPQGVIAGIQEQARREWQQGQPVPPPGAAWRYRYLPADALRDLDDLDDTDPASVNLLATELVHTLIENHYALHGRWPAKLKRRLAELARWDQRAAALAREALLCRPWPERRTSLEQLAAHILAPLGGLMPLEWHTEWEEVEP